MQRCLSNQAVLSRTLREMAGEDRRLVALTSDARYSAAIADFAAEFPDRFVEIGIAEQNLVSIAAGLAACGKIPFVFSPASFLSTRAYEQIKVDVIYAGANVKLVGVSGGVSYGPLGMTHHSLQDLACMRALPGLTVMVPSDNLQTDLLARRLAGHNGPIYFRTGRSPVPDAHEAGYTTEIGRGSLLLPGRDLTIAVCGELTRAALEAGHLLREQGISARVIEFHTIKPLDEEMLQAAICETSAVVTVEEHSVHGGLGGAVAEFVAQHHPVPMAILGLPDEPAVTGRQTEILAHCGLTPAGIAARARDLLRKAS